MKLRILHIEDDLMYYHLTKEILSAEGIDCEVERVDTRGKVRRALRGGKFDLVLCDYTIPSYSGMAALLDVRKEKILKFRLSLFQERSERPEQLKR